MKGKHHVIVQNNKLRYEFDIRRNITIIRGDSATGKTTLIDLIQAASVMGDESGIFLQCDRPVRVLGAADWEIVLPQLHENIIFIDEENRFITSQTFADAVKNSDNYFVLITREDLPNLPYSVDEIYGIHTSGKYHDTKRVYNEMYRIYSSLTNDSTDMPDDLLIEDSNSGYEFFSAVVKDRSISCSSAHGKSNLRKSAEKISSDSLMVIGDGAAIGPEMNDLFQLMHIRPSIRCYFPESFEWLILRSGLINFPDIQKILAAPEEYIESSQYFSWERFFTDMLIQWSAGGYLQYQKSELNSNYLHPKEMKAILQQMPWWEEGNHTE